MEKIKTRKRGGAILATLLKLLAALILLVVFLAGGSFLVSAIVPGPKGSVGRYPSDGTGQGMDSSQVGLGPEAPMAVGSVVSPVDLPIATVRAADETFDAEPLLVAMAGGVEGLYGKTLPSTVGDGSTLRVELGGVTCTRADGSVLVFEWVDAGRLEQSDTEFALRENLQDATWSLKLKAPGTGLEVGLENSSSGEMMCFSSPP